MLAPKQHTTKGTHPIQNNQNKIPFVLQKKGQNSGVAAKLKGSNLNQKKVTYYNMVKKSDGTYKPDRENAWSSDFLRVKSDNAFVRNLDNGKLTSIQSGQYGKQETTTGVYTYWHGSGENKGKIKKQIIRSRGLTDQLNAVEKSSAPHPMDKEPYVIRNNDLITGAILPRKENNLMHEFQYGTGPTNSIIPEGNPLTESLRKSWIAEKVRFELYDKFNGKLSGGNSLTNFGVSFGFTGILRSGFNSTTQFVGSASGDAWVSSDGKTITFVISDKKHLKSFLYHLASSHSRNSPPHVYGSTTQKYSWTEDVNPTYYKSKLKGMSTQATIQYYESQKQFEDYQMMY